MTIDELIQIVFPPSEPVHTGSREEWADVEKRFGVRFPDDYFEVAQNYGSGEFLSGTLEIANPFDPKYEVWLNYELKKLQRYQRDDPDEMPYAVFPQSDGLLPFGRDDNGNRFFWITRGEPNTGPIVCRSGAYHWEVVQSTLTNFLQLLITNKLDIDRKNFWGSDFLKEDWAFEPARSKSRRRNKS